MSTAPHEQADRAQPRLGGRWLAVAVLVVSLVVLVVPVLSPSVGGWPSGPAPWTAGCAEAAEGELRVGIVVDAGSEPGALGGTDVACVVVPAGAKSVDVLMAWSASRGRPLRHNSAGLLCSIGDHPATGCGETTADGYRYWSYWAGSSTGWTYSSGNPWVQPARPDRIEGWRFQTSSGTGADDQPPRGPSSAVCPPVAPSTTTVTTPGLAPPTVPGPGIPPVVPATPAPTPGPDVANPAPGPVPGPGVTTTAPGAAPDAATPAGPGGDDGAPTDTAADPADPTAGVSNDSTVGGVDVIDGTDPAVAVGTTGNTDGSSSGVPFGTVVALLVVLGLGGVAVVRARRGAAP